MTLCEGGYLLDVNVLYALSARNHTHHSVVEQWFYAAADLRWAICSFTEVGFLRNATAQRAGQIEMGEGTAILKRLAEHPGYRYVPITEDWQTLCGPFFKRLFGTKQVTAAYLLGLAVRNGMVLVTMDKGLVYLAGSEFGRHVLLLE